MKRIIHLSVLAVLVIALVGCATVPPRMTNTQSGYPEIIIDAPADVIKDNLISGFMSKGFTIERESAHMIAFNIPMSEINEGQAMVHQMLLGNSYSTAPMVHINFIISNVGGGKHKILARSNSEIKNAFGGQMSVVDLNGNAHFNGMMTMLQNLKRKCEASSAAYDHDKYVGASNDKTYEAIPDSPTLKCKKYKCSKFVKSYGNFEKESSSVYINCEQYEGSGYFVCIDADSNRGLFEICECVE